MTEISCGVLVVALILVFGLGVVVGFGLMCLVSMGKEDV